MILGIGVVAAPTVIVRPSRTESAGSSQTVTIAPGPRPGRSTAPAAASAILDPSGPRAESYGSLWSSDHSAYSAPRREGDQHVSASQARSARRSTGSGPRGPARAVQGGS